MTARNPKLNAAQAIVAAAAILLSLGAARAAADLASGFDPATIAAFVDARKAAGAVVPPALTKEQAERRDRLHVSPTVFAWSPSMTRRS
jgi:hypothetical protein